MKKAFDINDEKIIKMREVISRTDVEESILFKTYLEELIEQKTGKKETINKIASNCGLNYNNFDRYPIKNHKYPAKICKTYHFTLNEAINLYSRCGLCLSYTYPDDEDYLNSVITDRNSLSQDVNAESKVDCLLRLVKDHDYSDNKEADDTGFRKKIREIQNKLVLSDTESNKKQIFVEIIDLLKEEMNRYLWIMTSGNDCLDKESLRYTVFEISFACHFNRKETIELYKSCGFSLAPDYIKFDAFVSWLLDLELTNNEYERYYLYKTVASDMEQVKEGAFRYCSPTPERLDALLNEAAYYEDEDVVDLVYGNERDDNSR